LKELFEAMVIVVKVSLETTVHGWATLATKQDEAETKLEEAIRFLDVYILKEDPALVKKVGLTTKVIKLSDVCIADILLGYPYVPVRPDI
jgi:iron uptake system EfeUOB component EfeO/EfeM